MVILSSPDPVQSALRDWVQFQRTGVRIVTGNTGTVYPVRFVGGQGPEFLDGFFFLYPPFAALPTIPLAFLSPWQAYLACYLSVGIVTLMATLGLLRCLAVPRLRWPLWVLWITASAPWNAAVLMGHLSATLLASPVLALLAWSRRNQILAGASLSLLLAKPNWGLPVLFFLVVGRRWRMGIGFLLGGVALILTSLPLGTGLWTDWVRTMVGYWSIVTHGTPPWKQVTLYASIQSILGRSGGDPLVRVCWTALSILIMGALARSWFRLGRAPGHFPRLLGTTLLAIAVTNPYAYFYDAVLVVPSAIILWTMPRAYSSPVLRTRAMAVSLMTWGWLHIQFFVLRDQAPALAGLALGAWLGLEIRDIWGLFSDSGAGGGQSTASP